MTTRHTMRAGITGAVTETKHTPTPWKAGRTANGLLAIHTDRAANRELVAAFADATTCERDRDFIVHAVNAHDSLVEALRECEAALIAAAEWIPEDSDADLIAPLALTHCRAALKLAEGK